MLLSPLNVVGNIIGSGTALTNFNYYAIIAAILNLPSIVSLNNPSTLISTLNISENTTLNNITLCRSSLNVSRVTILNNSTTINGILSLKMIFGIKAMIIYIDYIVHQVEHHLIVLMV
jgi:hypothetical protein